MKFKLLVVAKANWTDDIVPRNAGKRIFFKYFFLTVSADPRSKF